MIEYVGDTEEGARAVKEIVKMFAGDITVALGLEDRSLTIMYWQGVNHGRDVTEAFGDVEDGEVEQCFAPGMTEIADGGFYLNARRTVAYEMGKILRKYTVAGIDDEDLRDTDRMRNDALNCPIIVEKV